MGRWGQLPRSAFSPFQSERIWAKEEVVEAVSRQELYAIGPCQALIRASSASTGMVGVLGEKRQSWDSGDYVVRTQQQGSS